jgi:zinc/manganese transport system substrate-binding protein
MKMENKGIGKKYYSFLALGGSLILTATVLLSGCGHSSSNTAPSSSEKTTVTPGAKINVVAAENFYGEVAQAVGGDRVEVTSILNNPNTDPHDFEPTPETSKLVNNAQVIIYNGVGYDAWMDKVLQAGSDTNSKSVIKVADDLMGKKEGDNEHVWYDPATMPKLATKIADDFAKLDPKQKEAFHKRAQTYIASLVPLQEKVQQLKQASSIKIDVSEPVFDYMAEALNLKIADQKFSKAIDEGTDPAPADLGQLQNDIKGKQVKLFIHNIQNSSPTIDNIVNLAKSAGIPVVKVTETEPKGKNYSRWMMDQLNEVGKALGMK